MTMQQLPWKKDSHGKYLIGPKSTKEVTLGEDCYTGNPATPIIPKGTTVKIHCTVNFGWMITPNLGFNNSIFKW